MTSLVVWTASRFAWEIQVQVLPIHRLLTWCDWQLRCCPEGIADSLWSAVFVPLWFLDCNPYLQMRSNEQQKRWPWWEYFTQWSFFLRSSSSSSSSCWSCKSFVTHRATSPACGKPWTRTHFALPLKDGLLFTGAKGNQWSQDSPAYRMICQPWQSSPTSEPELNCTLSITPTIIQMSVKSKNLPVASK